MKKLKKLSLKQLESEMSVIGSDEQRGFIGGSIDGNDCFFESLVYIGSWLGYNNQDYDSWINCYGSTYGVAEQLHAVTEGVTTELAFDFLSQNFGSVGYVSMSDFSQLTGQTMGILSVGGGDGHAVIIHSVTGNTVQYFDPDTGAYNVASTSNFTGAININ